MSIDYTLSVDISRKKDLIFTAKDVINALLANGWSLYSESNKMIYTNLGDIDDFDYISKAISTEEYLEIIEKKELNKEIIAFAAFFLEEKIRYRINVMIHVDYAISISPDDATRKLLDIGYKILDISWYLERIIPCFESDKMSVESFSFLQYY